MRIVTINNIDFMEHEGCSYINDYPKLLHDSKKVSSEKALKTIRTLVLEDLFFIVYFVLKIKTANAPFVVDACQMVQNGPRTKTLDIWARYHFKSTIITVAETIQFHLKYPEKCTCIFSYKKGAAEKFLAAIRQAYEIDFLKILFPDVLHAQPYRDSSSWSLQNGITLKRPGTARPQRTIQASGLIEGMLQGDHFERRIYDDVETDDIKDSPEQLDKCFDKYAMSINLGTGSDDDIERIIGTFYSHLGPMVRIRDMVDSNNQPIYTYRQKPATHDGMENGEPVLISQQKLDELKKFDTFRSQQLCDPTPRGNIQLEPDLLVEVEPEELPRNLHKFMIIDPAGSHQQGSKRARNDNWAVHVIGVSPSMDDIGASDIYLLDSYIDKADESQIVFILSNMYWRNGLIDQVAYERNGGVTPGWLVHFVNAVHARGAILSEESQNLVALSPRSQEKKSRITSALKMPLLNGKIHFVNSINTIYIEQLKKEMQLHPFWHDDGIDALAYIYQVMEGYGFRWRMPVRKNYQGSFMALRQNTPKHQTAGWLGV